MKSLLLTFLLLPFTAAAQVQDTVWLHITVTDFRTGQPIINAEITIDSTHEKLVDFNGKASFNLAAGTHIVEIAAFLYSPRNTTVTTYENSSTTYYMLFKEDLGRSFLKSEEEQLNQKRRPGRKSKINLK